MAMILGRPFEKVGNYMVDLGRVTGFELPDPGADMNVYAEGFPAPIVVTAAERDEFLLKLSTYQAELARSTRP